MELIEPTLINKADQIQKEFSRLYYYRDFVFFFNYIPICSFLATNSSTNRTVSSIPKEEESTHK